MDRSKRVRRRVFACERCRQRKIMCDAASPACSSCADAGAECLSFDKATRRPVPRSVTQYLTKRIAALERQSSMRSTRLPRQEDDTSCRLRFAAGRAISFESSGTLPHHVGVALHDTTPPFLGLTQRACLAGCALAPTELPSSKEYGSNLSGMDSVSPRLEREPRIRVLTLASVPVHVAVFLFRTYQTRIIPQYPIFHKSQVDEAFNGVFGRSQESPASNADLDPRHVYIVSLVLAISLSTAVRIKQKRAHALATGLFRNAMLHVSAVLTNDLVGLQALLLLIQYAFLDPTIANLWLLTGLSSEACIDMCLHRELPASSGLSILQRDIRRRVFWCAWEMEVAVSAAFHRPLRTQPTCIDVQFPSEYEDDAITDAGIDSTARQNKAVSRRIWLFRQLEASIISILYQNDPLPEGVTLESWMADVEREINEWKLEVHRAAHQHDHDPIATSQWEEMSLYATIASQWILVQLYRPCPRIKAPSAKNLTKAALAAVEVANGYREQQTTRFGYLKYVFHPCHHVFSSALVFLQALQYCKAELALLYTLSEVDAQADSFPRFFTTIAERWPAATRCLEEYTRLLGPMQEEYTAFVHRSASGWGASAAMLSSDGEDTTNTTSTHALDLSDSLNLWPLTYPARAAAGGGWMGMEYADPAWSIPYDWTTEFAFDLDV